MLIAHRHQFEDSDSLAQGLATRIARQLRWAIKQNGRASLAVSGGSTPKKFFRALSEKELAWDKVVITLVDERWVPASSPRSNAGLVKKNLLRGLAKAATFVSLYARADDPEAGIDKVEENLGAVPMPFDALILGMGLDGHTASFFPGGDNLKAALDLGSEAIVVPMRAGGAGEPRITLNLATIAKANLVVLHIEGDEKLKVLHKALKKGPATTYPIRAVLRIEELPLELFCLL